MKQNIELDKEISRIRKLKQRDLNPISDKLFMLITILVIVIILFIRLAFIKGEFTNLKHNINLDKKFRDNFIEARLDYNSMSENSLENNFINFQGTIISVNIP